MPFLNTVEAEIQLVDDEGNVCRGRGRGYAATTGQRDGVGAWRGAGRGAGRGGGAGAASAAGEGGRGHGDCGTDRQ